MLNTKKIGLFLGPALFILTRYALNLDGLSDQGNAVLACTLWVATWWITEAMPIAATSLLPIILFPLSGALPLDDTTASFGHRYIFLYLGGFILALSIEKWNLHKRIALNIINLIGTDVRKIILGFMIATAFLSMWISNTATAVMMLPIGIAIVKQMKDLKSTPEDENVIFGKALMLSIAFSASIGGLATLIGTPPNLVFAGIVQELYGIEISFLDWIKFGLPISLMLLFVSWVYLTRVAFKFQQTEFEEGQVEIKRQLRHLGKMSYEEKIVLSVFVLTGFSWISRSFFLNIFLPDLDDSIIALIAGVSLFIFNSSSPDKDEKIMHWEDAVKLPWGILLLFGSGLAIASGFQASGLATFIAEKMVHLNGFSIFIILLVVITVVNFLTEITSNLATIAMLLPILAPTAIMLDVHPYLLMVGATLAASCAFMLPVATPPNAVVFGSNYLKISDMVRVGIVMNVISILLVLVMVYFVLPSLWDFNAFENPF
ncbi:MAG: DASS family sodium-coupled anion symporter [Flavobacteriales bacterium]|nr:DASS family sodium-coupled anion symporter [Flavobacteriales bacterium]